MQSELELTHSILDLNIAYKKGLKPKVEDAFQRREANPDDAGVQQAVGKLYRPSVKAMIDMLVALNTLGSPELMGPTDEALQKLFSNQDLPGVDPLDNAVSLDFPRGADFARGIMAPIDYKFGAVFPQMVIKTGFQIIKPDSGVWMDARATGEYNGVNAVMRLQTKIVALDVERVKNNQIAVCSNMVGALIGSKPFDLGR